jgi:hypothetical protein
MSRKLMVALDGNGKVLGTVATDGRDSTGRAMTYRLTPMSGQTIHEIEVDDALLSRPAATVHTTVAEMLRAQRK